MKTFHIMILLAFLMFQGCTNQDMYNIIQSSGKFQCQNLPLSEYDDCIARYEESYGKYNQRRHEAQSDFQ